MLPRILLSLLFIPALAIVIQIDFLHSVFFFIFTLALSVLSARELCLITGRGFDYGQKIKWATACLPGSLLILLYFLNSFFMERYFSILYLIVYTIVICIGIAGISFRTGGFLKSLFIYVFIYVYVGVFCLSLLGVRLSFGALYTYFLFLLAWISDAGAYFIGTKFGKIRGIIKFSPNKTLEGYIAAFLLTVSVASGFKLLLGSHFAPDIKKTFALGLLIAIFAPVGDLVESWLKRKGRVKDSSGFLPGLGGVLDIFDSILFTAPFYYMALSFIQTG